MFGRGSWWKNGGTGNDKGLEGESTIMQNEENEQMSKEKRERQRKRKSVNSERRERDRQTMSKTGRWEKERLNEKGRQNDRG